MLRIYEDALVICSHAADVARQLDGKDKDLARQLRRCSSSVALNIAEGSASQGRNKVSRYFNALGSAKETRACLEVAAAMQYTASVDEEVLVSLEKVMGSLHKLTR
jgi:four helix bundle protein